MAGGRPKRPAKKGLIQQIEALPCLNNIDTMLLEGMSAPDIAKWIHEEQEVLLDFDRDSIAAALQLRRRQKQTAARQYHAHADEEADDDFYEEGGEAIVARRPKREVVRPSFIAKSLYDRTRESMDEIIEYEALYLAQRDRVEHMMVLEGDRGIFARDVGEEVKIAGGLLKDRVRARKDLGQIGSKTNSDVPQMDMGRYSSNTVKALQSPESRHRVIDLVQRMARLGKIKTTSTSVPRDDVHDDQIDLPMPEPEE